MRLPPSESQLHYALQGSTSGSNHRSGTDSRCQM